MTKRLATRGSVPAAAPASEPKAPRTRSRASRLVEIPEELPAEPDQPFAEGPQSEIDPELRHRLISEAAYRHFVERGYTEGGDLDDWLQAEAEVDHTLLSPPSR